MVLILLRFCCASFGSGELDDLRCLIPKSLLNHLNSFHGGMFKLNAKFDADLLLYSLSF